jgi:hypothetical protein
MIVDLVVAAALLLALAFVGAWALSPDFRARIERPKYRFRDAAADYDSTQAHRSDTP